MRLGSDWWVVVIVHTNHETTDAAKISLVGGCYCTH